MKGKCVAAILLLVTVAGRLAHGADPATCGTPERPWIHVIVADDFPVAVAPFVDLLRAELATRGFDLCSVRSEPRRPPVATIEVAPRPGAVTLNVEVRDAVTAKRVSRDIGLGAIPPDSQPLMVALAADELLRASWAELALRTAPATTEPVPLAVAQVVRDSAQRPVEDRDRVRLGVVAVAAHYAAGTTLYGADARVDVVLVPRLTVGLGLGLRTGPGLGAPDGHVGSSAVDASLSATLTVTPPERAAGLDAVARLGVERLSFAPTPDPTAVGASRSDYALLADLGAVFWLRVLRRLRLGAEVLGDLPVRRVYVTDAQVRIAGVAGVGLSAGLGAWSSF